LGLEFASSVKTALLGVGLMVALGGCVPKMTTNYTPLASIKADPLPSPASKATYRLGPGDEVEVKFFFAPELNDKLTVRPDGKISVMFAQDIQAAGLTADELASDIRAVLAPHVKQLDLVVIVRTFASQKAYVGGEVSKPGLVNLTGNESVLQVLAAAGWMIPTGGDTAVVVRRDASGAEKAYPVNVAQLTSGEHMEQNIIVQAGDIILVPPSDAVVTDRWVDQNIKQLLVVQPSFGVSYNVGGNRYKRPSPTMAPPPAVTAMANAPQNVTRSIGLRKSDPPALAPSVPRSARNNKAETNSMGTRWLKGTIKTTARGKAAPMMKAAAEEKAACTGLGAEISLIPNSSRA
jgi:polysaccharide biosynthesis/export protein